MTSGEQERCPRCRGAKQVVQPPNKFVPCPRCNGTGYVPKMWRV